MSQHGQCICAIGHEGVEVNKRSTRWIIISVAAALWGTTIATAMIELHMHWYLAAWLATFMASAAVLVYLADALAVAREDRREALAMEREARCEAAAKARHEEELHAIGEHGNRMSDSVFSARHWATLGLRGGALAQYDAAAAKEAEAGDETGPFRAVSRLY